MAIVLALLVLVSLLLLVERGRNARANRGTIAALQASEAKTRAILKALPDFMFVQDHNASYLDYYAVGDLYTTPDLVLGKTIHDVLPAKPQGTTLTAVVPLGVEALSS